MVKTKQELVNLLAQKNGLSRKKNVQFVNELVDLINEVLKDEKLLKRAAKYLRKLVAEKEDETLFTKEEFFRRVDEAKKGPTYELKDGETIEDLIERIG